MSHALRRLRATRDLREANSDNPRCPICGAGMAVYRVTDKAVVWRCDGITGWTKWGGAILGEGRWPDDPHAVRSERVVPRSNSP